MYRKVCIYELLVSRKTSQYIYLPNAVVGNVQGEHLSYFGKARREHLIVESAC